MSFNIEWIGCNAIVTLTGFVDFHEIFTANNMIIGNSKFDDMKFQIFDASNVEKFNLSEMDFKMIGTLDKFSSKWNPGIKVALVFIDEAVIKLIDKYIETIKDTGWNVKVFRRFEDAEKWSME